MPCVERSIYLTSICCLPFRLRRRYRHQCCRRQLLGRHRRRHTESVRTTACDLCTHCTVHTLHNYILASNVGRERQTHQKVIIFVVDFGTTFGVALPLLCYSNAHRWATDFVDSSKCTNYFHRLNCEVQRVYLRVGEDESKKMRRNMHNTHRLVHWIDAFILPEKRPEITLQSLVASLCYINIWLYCCRSYITDLCKTNHTYRYQPQPQHCTTLVFSSHTLAEQANSSETKMKKQMKPVGW